MKKIQTFKATVVYPIRDGYTVMGYKQRKEGRGKLWPYGGKMDPEDKTPEDCAIRETFKESNKGIKISKKDLRRVAYIDFYHDSEKNQPLGSPTFRVLFYLAPVFEGHPTSSNEILLPAWYPIKKLPWEDMRESDALFLKPIFEEDKCVTGWVRFKNSTVLSDIKECTPEFLNSVTF